MSLPLVDSIENLQRFDEALADLAKARAACDARGRERARAAASRSRGLAEARAAGEARAKELRALERDLEVKAADIAKLEGRYYQLQSEKEIEKYNSEFARLQGEKAALEERLLAAMEAAEAAGAEEAARERELREREPLDEVDRVREAEEAERLDGERARLGGLRADFAAGLPPEAVAEYEAVRARKPRAVVRVERDTCGGCHLSVAANVLSDLRDRGRLRKCKCGCILYLPPRDRERS